MAHPFTPNTCYSRWRSALYIRFSYTPHTWPIRPDILVENVNFAVRISCFLSHRPKAKVCAYYPNTYRPSWCACVHPVQIDTSSTGTSFFQPLLANAWATLVNKGPYKYTLSDTWTRVILFTFSPFDFISRSVRMSCTMQNTCPYVMYNAEHRSSAGLPNNWTGWSTPSLEPNSIGGLLYSVQRRWEQTYRHIRSQGRGSHNGNNWISRVQCRQPCLPLVPKKHPPTLAVNTDYTYTASGSVP